MIAEVLLNDPEKRNALSMAMFDSIDEQLAQAQDATVIRLRATGSAFCAGFDLAACVDDPTMLAILLKRLGSLAMQLRSHRAIVIAEVNGAAIAGGCAIVSATDIVLAAPTATFGYPVHRLGISPAVSLPTLLEGLTSGAARSLVLSGEIIDAEVAMKIGLVHRIEADLPAAGEALAERLASFPDPERIAGKAFFEAPNNDCPTAASIDTANTSEAAKMLKAYWSKRS